MKESVFTDTGFWIALFDRRDQNHIKAKSNLKPIFKNYQLFLSDFIVFETITYLNCSLKRHDLAIRFLEKIQNPSFNILVIDEAIKTKALKWFIKYSDKHLSMTDCTSFAIMNQKNIYKYAGFDEHFNQMGFKSV